MEKSRLIELYIKDQKLVLNKSEHKEYDLLKNKQNDYYQWILKLANDGELNSEIIKINQEKALAKTLSKLAIQKSHKFSFERIKTIAIRSISIAASISLLIYLSYQQFSVNDTVDSIVLNNPSRTITNSAKIITSDSEIKLNENKKTNIVKKDYKLEKTKDNYIKYKQTSDTNIYHTMKTNVCNQYKLQLADGSIIHLNSNTKIKYPLAFGKQKREIFIEGEVYCEIAKSRIPFIVNTLKGEKIKVLGTKFNVRAYKAENYSEISLVEGKVRVDKDDENCILSPNKQVIIRDGFKIKNVYAKNYMSWIKDVFKFYKMNIVRISNSLEQMYGVKIEFEDTEIESIVVAGGFDKTKPITYNLNLLCEICNLQFEMTAKNKFIIKKNQ
ncbi:MAG: FecR family protein [Marinifilaceae bacterium]|jgi:hypothetical protein|nr:FecR family protein [Marinifilaceae bacterium]